MDRYTARMNLHGTTQRERVINRLKTTLNNKLLSNPSYKSVKLNGEETHLVINSSTQPYYKDFQSLPSQEINIGDYVEWANSHWIVVTCDSDDEIYRDGKLNQCNYLLKWQNELGEIIERWAIIQSASKYNDGTTSNNVISLGSDQLSIIIPLDEEALKLKKSMGKKFFIDNNKEDPTVYELTGTGNVSDTYNGHGITSWIVKECAYSPTEDDWKYGVCNYVDYSSSTPSKPTAPDGMEDLFATISGTKNLRIGATRTYTAILSDKDGNAVQWNNSKYNWNVVGDFDVKQTVSDNTIKLLVDDDSLIGESFLLQIFQNDNSVIQEIEITITDIM